MNSVRAFAGHLVAGLLIAVAPTLQDVSAQVVPSDVARAVAAEIAAEVVKPPFGDQGRPLPLASHWNQGTVRGTFTPDHQISLIQEGHHILPWMSWVPGRTRNGTLTPYHERLLSFFAELNLPISMRGTQWPNILIQRGFRDGPLEHWAGVLRPDSSRLNRLSPFGSLDVWRYPADVYVDTDGMRRAQAIYPNPPRVIWISNNEPRDLRWNRDGPLEEISLRYRERYGEGQSGEFRRRVVGQGWIEPKTSIPAPAS